MHTAVGEIPSFLTLNPALHNYYRSIERSNHISSDSEKRGSELFSINLIYLTWNVESEISADTVHWHHKLILKSHFQ